jgi:hypothetical protein
MLSSPTPTPMADLTQKELLEVRKFPTKQSDIPLVGLWGMPKSGKTSFMAALYGALMRHGAEYHWEMVACNIASDIWASQRVIEMWDYGMFPPETSRGIHQVYTFDLRPHNIPRDTRHRELRFTFLDAAGEDLRLPLGIKNPDGNGDTVVDYLDRCDASIMLLDPLLGNAGDFKQFTNMLATLYERNGNKKLHKPLLFVVAKCDVLPFRAALASSEAAGKLLAERFPPQLPNIIRGYVEKPIICATSSLGFEDGQPQNLFPRYDGLIGIREPKKIRPRNVVEAFDKLAELLHS